MRKQNQERAKTNRTQSSLTGEGEVNFGYSAELPDLGREVQVTRAFRHGNTREQ